MDSSIREVVDLLVRWVHVIAGIMWVGNSMLFNWLDRNLDKSAITNPKSFGEIWLLHSGAYYQVEKKMLAPSEYPRVLHWFKWQAYTTWITGASLLAIVYYMASGGAYLVDPQVSKIDVDQAIDIGLGTVIGGFVFYDLTWRFIGKRFARVAAAITIAQIVAAIVILPRLLSGRAAYMHVGAMLGTMMAGNVFLHIVPSQRELVRATQLGRADDLALSAHAKQRSIHNNYFTFPVLFVMVSNHFPGTYGSRHAALILLVLVLAGATCRHFLNVRFQFKAWFASLSATILATIAALFALVGAPPFSKAAPVARERIAFSRVELVIRDRCVPCHSTRPTEPGISTPPNNVVFESPDQIKSFAERIKVRAVISKTMPLANKTQMTEEERDLVAKWLLIGAPLQ
jgi:uncharacterized membrane protein